MQKLAILVTRLSSWVLSKMGRGGSMPGRLGIKIAPDCLLRNLEFNAELWNFYAPLLLNPVQNLSPPVNSQHNPIHLN